MKNYILSEDLAVWFGTKNKPKGSNQPKGPWVNICRKDKDGKHPPCGRENTDKGGYPKCRAAGVAGKMSDEDKKAACSQKRRAEKQDKQTGKGQKPIMTSYKKKTKNETVDRLANLIIERIKVENNEYDKLYEDDAYLLIAPLTHKASCKYGASTKWCTTKREDDTDFEEYFNSGVLVYLIVKDKKLSNKLGSEKYTIYRGWGGAKKLTSVFNEINDEFVNGEEWITNEFKKIGRLQDIVKLLKDYNRYYNKLDFSTKSTVKKITESIKEDIMDFTKKPKISKELYYHIKNNISLSENVFRYGSDKYFEVINEARELMNKGVMFDVFDMELLNTDMGKFGVYGEGLVPLDFPILEQEEELVICAEGISIDQSVAKSKAESKLRTSKEFTIYDKIDEKVFKDGGTYIYRYYCKKKQISESEYQGKKVELGNPKKGGVKKYYVYVKNPKTGKVIKVSYGYPGMTANWNDPKARASFAARHQCEKKKDRTTPGYWACRAHKDFGNNVSGRYW